jgi:hypothetical protein
MGVCSSKRRDDQILKNRLYAPFEDSRISSFYCYSLMEFLRFLLAGPAYFGPI